MSKFEWWLAGVMTAVVLAILLTLIINPKTYEDGIRDCVLGKVKYEVIIEADTTVGIVR